MIAACISSKEKALTAFLLQTQVCSGLPLHAEDSVVKHAGTDLLSLAGLLKHQGQGGDPSLLEMVNQLQVEDKKKWGSDYSFPSEGSAKAKQPGGCQDLENLTLYKNPFQEIPRQTRSCQS